MTVEKLNSPRELRGLAILSSGNAITKVRQNAWIVKSQTGIGEYTVEEDGQAWSCTCPDFAEHKANCKHVFCVLFSLKLRLDAEAAHEAEPGEKADFAPEKCPSCEGANIVRRGIRQTKYGEVQRFGCLDCGHRFTIDKGFSRMKHDPKAITLAMDLYFKGISYRKIVDHLKQFYGLTVEHSTIIRWVSKYLKLLAQYSEKYKAEVGNVWHSDETTVFIKKEGEARYFEWIWNIMDAKTRFLLASEVTKTRYVKDARKALRVAKNTATARPLSIVTDGLQGYKGAILKEFYNPMAEIKNPHLRLKDFETKPNNNIVERLQGTFRERTKVMRALDSSDGASDYARAMRVYYNYIRGHQALGGCTPAQMAKIPIDLTGNRWMAMIEKANEGA